MDGPTVYLHLDIAIDKGVGPSIAETTAVDVAIDSPLLQPNLGQIGRIGRRRVDIALGRAAIDVAVDGRRDAVGIADGHGHIAARGGAGAVAAAKHAVGKRRSTRAHRTAVHEDVDSPAHGAAGIAAAVYTGRYCTAVHRHRGRTAYARGIAAAIDATHRGVGLPDGNRSIARHTGGIAAAIDIARDGSQEVGGLGGRSIVGHTLCEPIQERVGRIKVAHGRGIVTDVDLGAGCHRGRLALGTSEHIGDSPVDYVDHRRNTLSATGRCIGRSVSGIAAAPVDVVGRQGACASVVEHIDGDHTGDIAIDIAAAIGVGHRAAIEVEGDIAGDVGRGGSRLGRRRIFGRRGALGAAKDVDIGAAKDIEGDIAGDVGRIGAAIERADGIGIATCAACQRGRHVAGNVGFIGTAERLVDIKPARR